MEEKAPHVAAEPEIATRTPCSLGFPVVGIGASAGGLVALQALFRHVAQDAGMAYVVILHLSPTQESHADAILQRVTTMPVQQVRSSLAIEPNCVYVIPPTQGLTMQDGHLHLGDLERPRGRHVAIDMFFRTLARAHRERAIGIVLSGTGADGAVGLRSVKEEGGVAIAQSPREAEYDAMPLAAIATGVVDFVLPVAEIGPHLAALWDNARHIQLPDADSLGLVATHEPSPTASSFAEAALRDIMRLLNERTGHDFSHYKRSTVLRRIERRLQVNRVLNLPDYLEFLTQHAEETRPLLQDLLISVTNFFRDPEAFKSLKRELRMQSFETRVPPTQLRAWIAGCATGEEAYSIAMLLTELEAAQAEDPLSLHVLASDIDERAIAASRVGVFPASIVADVSATRLRRFFKREGNSYRIKRTVRDKIIFAAHNVLRDPPFLRLDLICCRNLLIYLDRGIQTNVLETFHFALQPGGLLMLGSSETAAAAPELFTAVDKRHRIYRANALARRPALRIGPNVAPRFSRAQPSAVTMPQAVRSPYEHLHQRLVEQYAPPTILIDSGNVIVHMSERAGRYLRHVGGTPSYDLLAVIQPKLRFALRTAIFQARESGQVVKATPVRTERNGHRYHLCMTAQPVREGSSSNSPQGLVMVVFDEEELTSAQEQSSNLAEQEPSVIALEAELRKLDEQLHGSMGESEASAEALRASNEELQAINEELRSATDELETSKEELQSVNEELVTVNYELKSKVEETAKVNDDLQNLMEATDIATIFVDAELYIKRFTPRATEIFNIRATDVGRSLSDITHRLDYSELVEDALQAFASLRVIERRVGTSTTTSTSTSTEHKWYLARVLPYRTTEDHIAGAVMTFVDVTALREAEDTLRARDERFRLVVDSTCDYAILTIDLQGRVTSWNLGAEHIFGYTEAEILGQPTAVLFTPEDVLEGAPQREMFRARVEGRAEDERWHLRKNGSRFYCSGIMTRLGGPDRIYGYAKIARDLTVSKRAESERESMLVAEKELRQQLESAAASKDEFLAVMSHELKNPLNLIQLNAELLDRLPEVRDQPAVRRSADVIRRTVMSQAQIIDDLLDLSRLHTGKLALLREGVSWQAVVMRIANAVQPEAEAKGVSLETKSVEDGESFWVYADPVRLEQIVWNLVANALKFTPAGGRIDIALSDEGRQVRLDVTDTGCGIEPDFIDHVFEMFRQRDSRTTRRNGGLGIGLALVSSLARLHGGHAAACSAGIGRGSRFSVHLPRFEGAPAKEADGRAENAVHGLRILLVDDAQDALESLAMLLGLSGALVSTALGGAAALQVASQNDFDLVVSDVSMPGMDGYQFIAELRRQTRHARTPAIALTGLGRPTDARNALAAGFDAHLSKPVELNTVIAEVRRLLP